MASTTIETTATLNAPTPDYKLAEDTMDGEPGAAGDDIIVVDGSSTLSLGPDSLVLTSKLLRLAIARQRLFDPRFTVGMVAQGLFFFVVLTVVIFCARIDSCETEEDLWHHSHQYGNLPSRISSRAPPLGPPTNL